MKFRYFELTGDALKDYLEAEAKEFRQRHHQAGVLLENHKDEIEGYRPDRSGRVLSIIFKEGKQPPGFIRADKRLPKKEVRPSAKGKVAEPWRKLLDELKVTADCQQTICTKLQLPCFVSGPNPHGTGMCLYGSRIGHVGPKVLVEVPIANPEESGDPDPDPKPFAAPDCMKEMEGWRVEELHADSKAYDYGKRCYTLPSKL